MTQGHAGDGTTTHEDGALAPAAACEHGRAHPFAIALVALLLRLGA